MKILLILCVLVVAGLATGKKIPGWWCRENFKLLGLLSRRRLWQIVQYRFAGG